MKHCVVCGRPNPDRAHIRSRGAGGTWDEDNIMMLCRLHHREQHSIGIVTFALKYPAVMWELEEKGWKLDLALGRKKITRSEQ